ncbi:MAG: energy transducer TonB [Alphaproteobacteria bacterium]|nr:energy transducer TonB [Alphaproteobacteria bacterium]
MLKKFSTFLVAAFAFGFAFATVTPAAKAADDMKSWQRAVIKSVAKNQRYPRSAIAREIEGKAKVRLVVTADGTITSHEVVEQTGEKVLDDEIPKLVEKLNPLPALPAGKDGLTFVLPLNWTLN